MEEGALLVAPSARIDARVRVTRLTVHGTMAGDIAAERVELTDTATVSGTLLSPAVIMREGALFNGAIATDSSSRQRRKPERSPRTEQTPHMKAGEHPSSH